MANAASTIEIELEIRDAINRLGKLEGELKKSSSAMDRVANSTRKMESAFKSARNAASALVAAISVQQIAQAADTFTNFANQIRIATNSAAEAAAVQKELYRVSQTTGTAIEDTTKLYARLRVAADQLGSSQAETIRITEIVAKSLAAAGTSSTEASGALLQLAQALNSPKVQAEEFNSLIDGMPNLLKEVEKQLGLTAGSLKKFVTDGNLTNQLFKDAILGSAEAINEQFGAAQDTIGTATQRINNSLTMLIGKFEQSTGIFNKTANALTKLATEFDKADNIVRQFSEVVVMLGVYFDKLKQLALALTKPLRDAFSVFSGGTSNPIAKTINYIQYSLSLLTVAVDYQTQNLAIRLERLAYQIRDFFIGMVANLLSFFESVDNFFINQINKVIGYYNSAADSIGMDGDVAPIATSTSARESELKFERDSAEFLADSYRRQADLLRQAEEAYAAVNAEFNQYTHQIDSGTLLKTEEQLGDVDLEASNAASSVEKLKEKIEEVKEIEYTDFTGKISQEQQDRFTEALEEEFRIRREMKQLTEAQNEAYGQQLEDQFRQVAEVEEYLGRINERGIERNEVEQTNYDYANEIAKVKADQNLTIEQEIQLVNALEDAQQRELNNQEKKLTALDRINDSLQTQLGLSEGAAAAVISGVSAAGPNASRAMNIANSRRPEEAALKLILSNEKVAAAIEEYFTILFDTLDPFIDILGDLISAINRLIGALAKGIGDGIQSVLDQAGVGQDSYLFGGGFARDFEQFSYDVSGGLFGVNNREDTGLSRDEYNAYSLGISGLSGQETIDDLLRNLSSVGLTGVLEGEDYKKVIEEINALARKGDATDQQRAQLLKNAAAAQTLLFDRIEEQAKQISNSEALSLLEEINQRGIERNEIDQIRINYSREIKEVSENLILTEEDQIRVITALEEARNREIEAIERQQQLLNVQTGGNELTKILDALEDTFDRIIDLVEDLKDQTLNLLFSDKSLAPASVRFDTAATRYQELLAAALDPDATEENVKDFQAFVDTYLKSAQDVFKSSSQYQNIFDSVLADIEEVSNFVSIAMPISEIESVKKQLVEVAEEFGIGIEEVIEGLDNLSRSLVYQAVVSNVPVSAFIDSEQSNLVIEAVVTAIADPERSDTQIEAVVTAIMGAGSDTVIDAIVKAVQAPGSDTTIEAVVSAIMAAGSDTQIEAIVKAVQAPGSTTTISTIVQAILDAKNSDTIVETPVTAIIDEANSSLVVDAVVTAVSGQQLEIDAVVTAVMATGSDTVIEAVVTAVEDQNLSDTEIEAIVTAAMATGSNTTILAVVNAILDAAKSDLTIEALVTAIAAAGSDTEIEAIVKAIMASGSDTEIQALVTAIAAAGSDTEIEAIVKAIMASGSDTQIEAIVSAVASNTPVISAIVAAVAANTPVVTPTVTLDDSEITSAFSSLSQTLEDSINRLIESIRLQELKSQAAASGIFTTGGTTFTYATNMAGGGTTNLISGSLTTDLRPSGDTTDYGGGLAPGFQLTGYLSTDQIFQALLNRARVLNPEVLSKPYYVLRATNASNSNQTPYLDAFDDLNSAQTFYDNALGNGYYYYKWNYGPVQKYGFRQGGLVPSAMDTIPAMLSPGEYILSPETVKRYGVSNLNSLNSGDTAAINATSDPEVKRLLTELIVAVRENDTEVNVYTDMKGQTKAGIEEFRSELRERTRRQGEQYVPARYI